MPPTLDRRTPSAVNWRFTCVGKLKVTLGLNCALTPPAFLFQVCLSASLWGFQWTSGRDCLNCCTRPTGIPLQWRGLSSSTAQTSTYLWSHSSREATLLLFFFLQQIQEVPARLSDLILRSEHKISVFLFFGKDVHADVAMCEVIYFEKLKRLARRSSQRHMLWCSFWGFFPCLKNVCFSLLLRCYMISYSLMALKRCGEDLEMTSRSYSRLLLFWVDTYFALYSKLLVFSFSLAASRYCKMKSRLSFLNRKKNHFHTRIGSLGFIGVDILLPVKACSCNNVILYIM